MAEGGNEFGQVPAAVLDATAPAPADADGTTTLQQVAELAAETIPSCDVVGVSWITDKRGHQVETLAATDEVAVQADVLQYELGEGPCLSAVWEDGRYAVADIASDPRWPRWGPRAAQLGLGSVLSVRLATSEEVFGALNLYSRQPGAPDRIDLDLAQAYATYASIALAALRKVAHVHTAMQSRHVIGMAQGILMERHRITQQQAFMVLAKYSQNHNEKLRVVAAQLVEAGELP
jgi:GAF domain-containing protein